LPHHPHTMTATQRLLQNFPDTTCYQRYAEAEVLFRSEPIR